MIFTINVPADENVVITDGDLTSLIGQTAPITFGARKLGTGRILLAALSSRNVVTLTIGVEPDTA